MLLGYRGQDLIVKFSFNYGSSYYDPLLADPVKDIYISINRGLNANGSVIQSAISVINSSFRVVNITAGSSGEAGYIYPVVTFDIKHSFSAGDSIKLYGIGGNYDGDYVVHSIVSEYSIILKGTKAVTVSLSQFDNTSFAARLVPKSNSYVYRESASEYVFVYKIPENLFSGNYTISIKTTYGIIDQSLEINFIVPEDKYEKSAKIVATEINENSVILHTQSDHSFNVGDYISVENVSLKFDGKYYVTKILNSKKISFSLQSENQSLSYLNSPGFVKLIDLTGVSPVLSGPNQPTKISYRPKYSSLDSFSTNSILLIGHADNLEINDVIKIKSIQEAINLIGADGKSPLLRGVMEAYNSGAKDIYICAAAPMFEYVDYTSDRNTSLGYLQSNNSTPQSLTFYQKYYERLSTTYDVIKYYEFIDIVVPLEISLMNTGELTVNYVDFITQFSQYLSDFHNNTGFVQIGIIGSRSNGVKDSDIAVLESNALLKNKFTIKDDNGEIISDSGRFLVPVYGEISFNHVGFPATYIGTASAAYAGLLSTTPVYNGLIRKRLPAGYSLYGSNLSMESLLRLDNMGINTIYRSRRANRGNPYELYVSNDYTMAAKESIFNKLTQLRLAAMVINEIKSIGYDSIGKFAYDSVISKVRSMLNLLVASKAIRDYSFDAYADKYDKGIMIFQINLVSSLNLKNIQFSISAGPGA